MIKTWMELQPIGDDGFCLVGGQVPDPDNPATLIDCPKDNCDGCRNYGTDELVAQLMDLLII